MLNNQHVGSTSCTPSALFLGRPGWNLFALNPDGETGPTVNQWLEHQFSLSAIAKKNLREFRARTLQRKNRRKSAVPYKIDDLVLVHPNQFPKWQRKKLSSPWWGPFRVQKVTTGTVHVMAAPKLGGLMRVAHAHLKRYPVCEEGDGDIWEALADEAASAIDQDARVAEEEVPLDNELQPEELIVEAILKHRYKQGWRFLTKFRGYPIGDCVWETPHSFAVSKDKINDLYANYCETHGITTPLALNREIAKGMS